MIMELRLMVGFRRNELIIRLRRNRLIVGLKRTRQFRRLRYTSLFKRTTMTIWLSYTRKNRLIFRLSVRRNCFISMLIYRAIHHFNG